MGRIRSAKTVTSLMSIPEKRVLGKFSTTSYRQYSLVKIRQTPCAEKEFGSSHKKQGTNATFGGFSVVTSV
jgi:hypothetical protein